MAKQSISKSTSSDSSKGKKRSHSSVNAPDASLPKPTVFRQSKKAKQQHEASNHNQNSIKNKKPISKVASNSSNSPKPGDLGTRKPAFTSNNSNSTSNPNSKPKPKPKPKKVTPKQAPPPPTTLPTFPPSSRNFRIIVGSYERLLYGFKVDFSHQGEDNLLKAELKPIFTFPAHASSIKSVSCSGAAPVPQGFKDGMQSKWLVTGGTDETIKVWDLRKKIEVGQLTGHEGELEWNWQLDGKRFEMARRRS